MNDRDHHTDTSLINIRHDTVCFMRCGNRGQVQVGSDGIIYCAEHYLPSFIGRLWIALDRAAYRNAVVA